MIATYLPDKLTPVASQAFANALAGAVREVIGRDITADGLAVLIAQSALETGHWKATHRSNVGNIKASSTYVGHYTSFRCNEIVGGVLKWYSPTTGNFPLPPGHPQTRFRAYLDLEHGVLEHAAFLAQRPNYARAWAAALDGDPAAYAHELKVAHYYTASEALYRRGVVALCKQYRAVAEKAEAAECSQHPCAIDENTTHSPRSDEDLKELHDDWVLDAAAQEKVIALENADKPVD